LNFLISGFTRNEAGSNRADHDRRDCTSDNHENDGNDLFFEVFGGVVSVADGENGLGRVVETLDVELLERVVVLVVQQPCFKLMFQQFSHVQLVVCHYVQQTQQNQTHFYHSLEKNQLSRQFLKYIHHYVFIEVLVVLNDF
jgi:hypothetical protein